MDAEHFLNDIKKQYSYYRKLAEKAIEQVSEEEFFWQQHEHVNSVAIIVKHITGNLLSRFHDFKTSDGEKSWRNRDDEFEINSSVKDDYMEVWQKAWTVLENEFESLTPEHMTDTIFIREQAHLIPTALIRSVTHTAHHIGQIIYQAKIIKAEHWTSLSIPKGQSQQFNDQLKATKDQKKHYTDHL